MGSPVLRDTGSISAFHVKFLLTTNKEKVKAAGASPQTPMGELTALPQTPYLGAELAPYCTYHQSLQPPQTWKVVYGHELYTCSDRPKETTTYSTSIFIFTCYTKHYVGDARNTHSKAVFQGPLKTASILHRLRHSLRV